MQDIVYRPRYNKRRKEKLNKYCQHAQPAMAVPEYLSFYKNTRQRKDSPYKRDILVLVNAVAPVKPIEIWKNHQKAGYKIYVNEVIKEILIIASS